MPLVRMVGTAEFLMMPFHAIGGSSREPQEIALRRGVASWICALWFLVGGVENGRCDEAADRDNDRDLSHEIAAIRATLEATPATGDKAVLAAEFGIRQTEALEREREKTKTLLGELGLARTELDMTRLAIMTAWHDTDLKLEAALDQERKKSETFVGEVTRLQTELDKATAFPAGKTAAVSTEQALRVEREQEKPAPAELTRLQANLDRTRAALSEAEDAAATGKQQRQALLDELTKQHERADAATSELTRRSELLTAANVRTSQEEEMRRTLQTELVSERERSSILAQELASVRNMIENAARPPDAALASQTTVGDGAAALPGRVPGPVTASAPPAAGPDIVTAAKRAAPVAATPRALADESRLLARVSVLLRDADIGAARALLEHAVERGSARAAYMLAETYNARVLQSWRTRGIAGDPVKARELYERAQAGGINDAEDKLRALQ